MELYIFQQSYQKAKVKFILIIYFIWPDILTVLSLLSISLSVLSTQCQEKKIIMRILQSYIHTVDFTLTAQLGPATFQGLKDLMWQVATGWTM